MATLEEIQQREEELRLAEQQNQQVIARPIPVRRFGTGVTQSQQQQVIQNRNVAEQNIQEINKQKQDLQNAREQIRQQEEERQRVEQEIGAFNDAKALAGRNQNYNDNTLKKLGLSKRARSYYRDLVENRQATEKYVQTLKNSQEQGLTPVIQNGKIVGFLDEVRQQSIPAGNVISLAESDPGFKARAVSAGIITIEGSAPTISEEIRMQSLSNTQDRVQTQSTIQNKPTSTGIKQKAEEFRSRVISGAERLNLDQTPFSNVVGVLEKPRFSRSRATPSGFVVEQNKVSLLDVVTLPLTGLNRVGSKANIEVTQFLQNRPIVQEKLSFVGYSFSPLTAGFNIFKTPERTGAVAQTVITTIPLTLTFSEPILLASLGVEGFSKTFTPRQVSLKERFGGAIELATVGTIAGIKTSKFLTEELVFKGKIPETTFTANTNTINTKIGNRVIDVSSFEIQATREARTGIKIRRIDELTRKAVEKFIPSKGLTLNERRLVFGGEVVTLTPKTAGTIIAPKVISEGGKIVGKPITITTVGTDTKTSKPLISFLEGESKEISIIGKGGIKELPPLTRQSITKLLEKESRFDLRTLRLEEGNVLTTDIGRLDNGIIRFKRPGRRVSRGQVISGYEELISQDLGVDIGRFLVERKEISRGRLFIGDVSLPQFLEKSRRKIPNIQDVTTRIELQSLQNEPVNFISSSGATKIRRVEVPATALNIQKTALAKTLQKEITSISKVEGVTETQRINNLPQIVGGGGKQASQFSGTTQIQREDLVLQNNFNNQNTFSIELSANRLRFDTRLTNREIVRAIPRELTREITRESLRELTEQTSKLSTRQVTRQITREPIREVTRQPRTIPRNLPRANRIPPLIPRLRGVKGLSGTQEEGFNVFLRRRGKFELVGSNLGKGEALQLGSIKAKTTLGATFQLRESGTGVLVKKPSAFNVDFNTFRLPKSTSRLNQPLTFIQRASKRLSSSSEVGEIQRARRLRL